MKIRLIIAYLVCMALLSLFQSAKACDCQGSPPGNPACYECRDGEWQLKTGKECGQDSDCGNPDCYNCLSDCTCECDISVVSVTPDKNAACVGCDITFTAVTEHTSCVMEVLWSGGDPLQLGEGETFITNWNTAGLKAVTASVCDGYVFKNKTVTIVQVENITFNPLAICANAGCTSTASAQITPDTRTITWSIQGDNLGCNINSTTGIITAGNDNGTIIVRAADSELSDCYTEKTINIVNVAMAAIDRIPPGKSKDVIVIPSPDGDTINLEAVKTSGTTGSATVNPSSINAIAVVTVTGGDQSSEKDNLTLRAKIGNCVCVSERFTVCAHPTDFAFSYCIPIDDPIYYGLTAIYIWNSDSDDVSDLDKCKLKESFDGADGFTPPFYDIAAPTPTEYTMSDGNAGDDQGYLKSGVRNYIWGSAWWYQTFFYECNRCGHVEKLLESDTKFEVYEKQDDDWWIKTTVSGLPPSQNECSEDQDIIED